jgi:hypothetical protein
MAMFHHAGADDLGLALGRETRQPQENYAAGQTALAKNELAEVFITGKQEEPRPARHLQDGGVRQSGIQLGDGLDFVALVSEPFDDRAVDALVGEEPHAARSGMG